jgi:NAD(P)-dependent dehydrogenase (short-subunit alcohol dehydrogenase family)
VTQPATSKIIVVTGASSGFGAMTVRALADAGHVDYAGMRGIGARNEAAAAADAGRYAAEHDVALRPVEMDVSDQSGVDAAIDGIIADTGRLDVVVHNAGPMVLGPAVAFTPDQLAAVYDTNVLSTQRVNRAALPHLRARGDGLIVWVGSSSTRGGTPPYLAPYFAAKAAELARFGIDTTIVVPGAFTTGTNHFANPGHAEDAAVADAYETKYAGLMDQVAARLAHLAPADADPSEVARQIVAVVGTPWGRRPFRVHIDPANDGSEEVNELGDRIRREFYGRIGLSDLLRPALQP